MEREYQHTTFQLERDHWWYRARRRIILSAMDRHLGRERPQRILEIGCGAGTILRELAGYGTAVGVDPSADAVDEARRRSGCEVRLGSIPNDLPADIGRFDAVCLFDVIEHLDDDLDALRSIRQLLVPSGRVFVTVPAHPWLFGVHDRINQHRRRYTAVTLRERITRAGLECGYVTHFNTLLSPLLVPVILWRNHRRSGHHFELRTRFDSLLEWTMGLERHLMRRVRLPLGLSLFAVGQQNRVDAERSHLERPTTAAQPVYQPSGDRNSYRPSS